jgi:hypothetical protein
MSPFFCFRGPSAREDISKIPCKSAQLIFTEVASQRVTGIFKTPSDTITYEHVYMSGGSLGLKWTRRYRINRQFLAFHQTSRMETVTPPYVEPRISEASGTCQIIERPQNKL